MKQHDEQHRLRTCLWIVNTIQRRGRLTLREINELWLKNEISRGEEIIPRTFYNYRSAIQDLFNILIECDKKTNTYYISLRDDSATTEWLLSSFSVSQLLQQNRNISSRILLEDIPSGQQYLSAIIDAMQENNVIEVSYQRFVEDQPHDVKLEPYCTKLFHQRWYVVARNIERNHLQTYALDRILDIRILPEKFTLDPNFNAEVYFANSFGIFTNEHSLPQRIILRVEATQSKYLRTLPLHHSQKEIATTAKFSDFEFMLVPTQDFIFEIQSKGNMIEVLEPADLRKQMKENAKKTVKLYAT